MRRNFIYLLIVLLVFLSACRDADIETVTSLSPPVSGQGNIVHSSAEGGEWPFVYSHNIGSTPKDVYFIFTNPTYTTFSSDIEVQSNSYSQSDSNEIDSDSLNVSDGNIETSDRPINAIPDYIREFNNHPPMMESELKSYNELNIDFATTPVTSLCNFVGTSTHDFIIGNIINGITVLPVNSTCRASRMINDVTVDIWVANDAYDPGCDKSACMDTTMAKAFLDKFLFDGTNDIYGWMNNIIGEPWGNHNKNKLIPSSAKNSINILFYDIPAISSGTIIGYFFAKDNYLDEYDSTSNERLIFYMDSVLAATPSGGDGWEISDDYPSQVLSTLSHEFQHMINFYQKPVLRAEGTASEDWLNEMSSLMSEDLMSSKLAVDGPRGVTYSDFSAGSSGNGDGRLPWFNYYNDESTVIWNASYSYSVNYALGAYLLRNFGGANFLKYLVQSPFTNTGAIDYALSQMGYDFNFSDILQRWGVSVLLSDQLDTSLYYRYNTGASFNTIIGTTTYQIGSINMYNYTLAGQAGPKTVSISELPDLNYHNAASNILVKAGSQLTGTQEWAIKMGRDINLSVVLK
jgi:hypothetical protein